MTVSAKRCPEPGCGRAVYSVETGLHAVGLRAIGQIVADQVIERLKGQSIKTAAEYELLHGTIKAAVRRVLAEEPKP